MPTIFLSYCTRDYFFAEMLGIKLAEAEFKIWRDQGAIRAGDDWRQSIEDGIKESLAVVVALSSNSANSSYVTYEWAYAIGMGKPVIPVKLDDCKIHPKLEPTQHIDFSYPRALPWDSLIERLNEIDVEGEPNAARKSAAHRSTTPAVPGDAANEILGYLNARGFNAVSYERLMKKKIGGDLDKAALDAIVDSHPELFRHARIKGGLAGLAKRVP
jgi:hypothetical protein